MSSLDPTSDIKHPARCQGTAKSLESLGNLLLLRETRCPFSSSAGDAHSQFSDNCWIVAVRGPDALGFVLQHAAGTAHAVLICTVNTLKIDHWWDMLAYFNQWDCMITCQLRTSRYPAPHLCLKTSVCLLYFGAYWT